MYGRDEAKTDEILNLGIAFDKMLRTGTINRETIAWIDPHRNMSDRWDRDLTRNGW